MPSHFDPFIVCLSVLASILAVYVALDLTGRVAASGGAVRSAWILAGALVTGAGMWTMHFTGMLALHLPVTVTYTVNGVLLALAIAVAASILSLLVAATRGAMSPSVVFAGCVLGIGMGAMHVVAMSAMRMAATPVFDTPDDTPVDGHRDRRERRARVARLAPSLRRRVRRQAATAACIACNRCVDRGNALHGNGRHDVPTRAARPRRRRPPQLLATHALAYTVLRVAP